MLFTIKIPLKQTTLTVSGARVLCYLINPSQFRDIIPVHNWQVRKLQLQGVYEQPKGPFSPSFTDTLHRAEQVSRRGLPWVLSHGQRPKGKFLASPASVCRRENKTLRQKARLRTLSRGTRPLGRLS